jgi:predicted SnoaL-like aldol condensation-catalyzing enzyme
MKFSRAMNKDPDNLKSIAEDFLVSVASGKVADAYRLYTGESFKHHNIHFKGDADSLREAMEEDAVLNPEKKLEIKLTVRENNMVVLLSHVSMKPGDSGYALVHIFRFENNKIVELWDIAQIIPPDPINELGAF